MPQGGSGPAFLFSFNSDLPPPPPTPNQLPSHSSKTVAEDISLSSPPHSSPFSFQGKGTDFFQVKDRKKKKKHWKNLRGKGGAWRNHTSCPPPH